mgnify:CR=1 FL=1
MIIKNKQTIVGSPVYTIDSGLGKLAQSFYDAGIIQKVLLNNHTSRGMNPDRYPDRDSYRCYKTFLSNIDTLFILEHPLSPIGCKKEQFLSEAKQRGIKIVLMPMYECTDRELLKFADAVICPSLLDLTKYMDGRSGPVAKLVQALPLIKSKNIKIIIRAQDDCWPETDRALSEAEKIKDKVSPSVEVFKGNIPQDELWNGDVFVFPEKFNGLSLPIQEAYSSGMGIMCSDRFPMNSWLPRDMMITIRSYEPPRKMFPNLKSCEYEAAIVDPIDIASCIDLWANKDITHLSKMGKDWAYVNRPENLIQKYRSVLNNNRR